jgi:hypothetical protein
MILLNCALSRLQSSRFHCVDYHTLQEEIEIFATQICQSYEYCAKFSPFGNLYMKFALPAAHLGISRESSKAWIVSRQHEISKSLRISPMSIICMEDPNSIWISQIMEVNQDTILPISTDRLLT